MRRESRHLSVVIGRPAAEVYAFVSDPANLPRWAGGLGGGMVQDGGRWFVETPVGRARFTFAPQNDLGVLDHEVVTPAGATVRVPMRVVPWDDVCEVVITLRRVPGMSDADLEGDAALMQEDLELLKAVLEAGD